MPHIAWTALGQPPPHNVSLHWKEYHILGLKAKDLYCHGTSTPKTMENTGAWDDHLGNKLVSTILRDTKTVWILSAIIYPSQVFDGIDR